MQLGKLDESQINAQTIQCDQDLTAFNFLDVEVYGKALLFPRTQGLGLRT